MNLIQKLEQEEIQRMKKTIPEFSPGDTVVVRVNVVEGDKKREQAFEGVVIAKRNRGLRSAFIVRKISSGEGVERTFQTYSPLIAGIEVKRKGEVRRSKLYYLRERSGKSARIREKLGERAEAGRGRARSPEVDLSAAGHRKGPAGPFCFYNPAMNARTPPPSARPPKSSPRSAPASIVVLVDDEDRENEGDLVFAADFVTPGEGQLPRHARPRPDLHADHRGARRAPRPAADGEREPLAPRHQLHRLDRGRRGHHHRHLGARPRAHHPRRGGAETRAPSDIVQPGHVFPLIAQDGGVLVRAGHTEACCDLARLAGLTPAAVLCEIMRDDGTMARLPDLMEFAAEHKLKIGTIADLIEYRSRNESLVQRGAERDIETAWGRFRLVAYRDLPIGATHLALVLGKIERQERNAGARARAAFGARPARRRARAAHSWGVGEALQRDPRAGSGVMVLLNCCQSRRSAAGAARASTAAGAPGPQHGPAHLRHRRADPARPGRRQDAPAGRAAQDAEHGRLRPRGHRLRAPRPAERERK